MILHAGLIALRRRRDWAGVLIRGPSGSGKSDLALRAIAEGFQLVADDRTLVFLSRGQPFGRAPPTLHGLIEARGLGVLRHIALPVASIVLSVQCKKTPQEVERLPDARTESMLGVEVPTLDLWPFEHTAPAKIRRAIEHLGVRP